MNAPELLLLSETKLYEILRNCNSKSRLESSGVAVVNKNQCAIVFDNRNQIALVDLSIQPRSDNKLIDVLGLGAGFEDLTIDPRTGTIFLLIECLKDADGSQHGFIIEYDRTFRFLNASRLEHNFYHDNKGFEGVFHSYINGREYLFGLCESGTKGPNGIGDCLIVAFERAGASGWVKAHELVLQGLSGFEDYSGMAILGDRLAVVSQASGALWVGNLDLSLRRAFNGTTYRFPDPGYCNVEGVAWASNDRILVVSDRAKTKQKKRCKEKDQSIHLFQIPNADPETR